jgi:hypothetical protein
MLGTGGGCLGDGDGRSVPLRVVNRSGERRRPAVSVTERGSGEAVFSRTVALGPGDDREFTVGPIDPERRDTVAHELGDQTGAESVAGDDLRAVEVAVGSGRYYPCRTRTAGRDPESWTAAVSDQPRRGEDGDTAARTVAGRPARQSVGPPREPARPRAGRRGRPPPRTGARSHGARPSPSPL